MTVILEKLFEILFINKFVLRQILISSISEKYSYVILIILTIN